MNSFRIAKHTLTVTEVHHNLSPIARIDFTCDPIRLVICDLFTSPSMNMAGARMLYNLAR